MFVLITFIVTSGKTNNTLRLQKGVDTVGESEDQYSLQLSKYT